tara:strand:+ start:2800 stop:3216 length:417 start_codon:yes stop_codon:yes gene_type:complete
MTEKDNKFYQELKNTRNSKKITLQEISEYTKINVKYLEALENGDFNILPNVYTRLFLRSYCQYLGVEHRTILDEYEIYTLGHKQREIVTETSLEENNDNDEPYNINILEKSKNYKEIIAAIAVIVSIIILFTIINNFN